ncbi:MULTISPECIES: GNAT family N-acetyltransferase [Marinomonas]|uniref:GNAT family N-acetyltransferase n=1 Tax=Marinomonas TaxID=28253 RepID=UPI0007AF170B|nr:GNAT family protein [Marinomonas sp. TW1]KZN14269.1 acetyltransferase [Marinomonas sp. TW1]
MIHIEKMTTKHVGRVIDLNVLPDQQRFVGPMTDSLALANAQVRPYIICDQEDIVGFFIVDTVFSQSHDFADSHDLGLRKFFIDQAYQGKGFAGQALRALDDHLEEAYPRYKRIFLTVNCLNIAAKACYEKAGFKDTQTLYEGGPSGPQHIMVKSL